MSSKAMSLKARIRNYARQNHIAAQVVLQNFMFERFLATLAESDYKDKFVIKGGMLIAAIVGLDTRSTMDLDTTLRGMPLTEEKIDEAFSRICKIDPGDEMTFKVVSIEPIRKDDRYGGFRVRIDAIYELITTPLSIDISTGDVLTPAAVPYEFSGLFDENVHIRLWGYSIETILAEKAETILSRGMFNTRPRDFYDVYILVRTQPYNQQLFEEALAATAQHRRSLESIADRSGIIAMLSTSGALRTMWEKYRKQFAYASGISYDAVIDMIRALLLR